VPKVIDRLSGMRAGVAVLARGEAVRESNARVE
jgi:hypothetical protein